MNQDSEQNRPGRPDSRRDGESRSFGRRDDAPRFNRSNNSSRNDRSGYERSGNERSSDSDKPRFNRDRDNSDRSGSDRSSNDRPRFNREGGNDRSGYDRSGSDRPRFNRDGGDRPSFNRDRNSNDRSGNDRGGNDRPRFDREGGNNSRGGYDRSGNDRSGNDQPRFNRDNNERGGNDRPTFNRDRGDRGGNDRPRFNRDGDNSRGGNERSGYDRSGNDRPRFDRDRNDRGGNDRPRFNRDGGNDRSGDRPSFNRDRNDDRPRFNREGGNDRPRFNRDGDNSRSDRSGNDRSGNDRPRFNRDRSDRSDKPAFKRVGGFQRNSDERNRENWNRSDRNETPRRGRRQDGAYDPNDRFTSDQRKDSGDRRTGQYKKAPNYELEIARNRDMQRNDRPTRNDRSQGDKENRPVATVHNDEPGLTRLNRYIANSGVCSRREADELIAQGNISVNGKVVTEMGYKVKEGDTVKYGTKVLNPERFVYVLLNKPKDYITTTDDPEERKTVMELVADAGNFRMYPVGRLDRNTTGLLLLTNDGELADKLTHPSYNVRKIYQVELDKPITEEHFDAIKQGITLEDGEIKPDALSIVTPDAYVVGIEIHSGRNRIVRRIFENFGYEVTKLDRTTYAGLTKKELPRGKWRFLEPKEVIKLKYLN
ncbi:pseudouridine synthase [Spirosoma sp. KUDC1026]|uniref:pseudouridine synthase n=1 Tax=Spirosoma sp. KUDC1026 TaxID=2745947 RepID=UPI00159BAD6D|nr:pseudouridine synthase [Spirosoma sp. KUDC1026]QKZ11170.1 pseudouridine synthase [Spirosoma sp. KUDC1026]